MRFYEDADAIVRQSGVADRESSRVPGFPYLRSNRHLASVGQQTLTASQTEAWIDRLQQLDQEGRKIEYRNLSAQDRGQLAPDLATFELRLDDCARIMRRHDRSQQNAQAALKQAAEVPSSYSTAQRVFGLYPVTSAFLHAGVRNLHEEIREVFRQPLEQLPVRGRMVHYVPSNDGEMLSADAVAQVLKRATGNPLRIPEPQGADRERLFHSFAPVWEVDVASTDDRIGTPAWRGDKLVVDISRPVVYTRLSHTRFEGQTLLQLNYVVWFPARTKDGIIDPLAGRLDGITWRVTLAPDGVPLVYDTIHNCGCYHMFFPGERLEPVPDAAQGLEPPLVPQRLTDKSSARRIIRLAAGNHYIQRVYSGMPVAYTTYELDDYRTLSTLPTPEGGHRSLFAADGLVPSSVRGERWFLWPSGVKSPGTMRQWGHHALAFLDTRHFDDPYLIQRFFRMRAP